MAGFKIADFAGMSTALSPKVLKANIATHAENCEVGDGRLSAMKAPAAVSPNPLHSSPDTIYEYTPNKWFEFSTDVDVARIPNAFDDTDKVAYTGNVYPRITRDDLALSNGQMPLDSFRLGLPAPTITLTVTVTGTAVDDALDDYRSYIYTWVDAWGEESAPGAASALANVKEGQSAVLALPTKPSGDYNFGTGAFRRIYRSNTGTTATEFQFVADVDINASTYTDSVLDAGLGEVIPTINWVRPPDEVTADFPTGPMLGITTLPSGALVGFSGKTLVYSEAYIPYAYPLAYRYTIKDDIVGISTNSQGLVIATTGKPHLAMGHDPASVSIIELDEFQACVSKRSVVDMGESTIYASPDGLVLVQGNQTTIITEPVFTREQWQALNPEQIHAYRYEGKYVGFTDSTGFIFDPRSTEQAWVYTTIDAACGHYVARNDALYIADGSQLKKWGEGTALSYTWTSKIFESPRPINLGAIQVGAQGSVQVKIYGDGVLRATVNTTNDFTGRLPAGYLASEWQVTLIGTADVDYVKLATSIKELQTVE
jgi:hypothetical protein